MASNGAAESKLSKKLAEAGEELAPLYGNSTAKPAFMELYPTPGAQNGIKVVE